eukprot:SAG31_NODE_41380_length_276_cov_0.864407_1_plen_67_part_01
MNLNAATEEVKALTDEKYRLESASSELRAKLSTCERQNTEVCQQPPLPPSPPWFHTCNLGILDARV